MNRYTLLVAASLSTAALVGCQQSHHAEADVDVDRPHTTANASAYTVPYTVSTDTSYMRSSSDATAAGTLRTGDVVYLRSDAPTSGTVAARTSDGRVVYVRASDLRRQ
jgi:hypothetical protein